jgi:hypothetical protein
MFHVKHLELLETSIVSRETSRGLGNQGFAVSFTTPGRYSGGPNPVFSNSSDVHLEGLGEGGSETINVPPFFRRGLARGAVTSGLPKPRHTTASY